MKKDHIDPVKTYYINGEEVQVCFTPKAFNRSRFIADVEKSERIFVRYVENGMMSLVDVEMLETTGRERPPLVIVGVNASGVQKRITEVTFKRHSDIRLMLNTAPKFFPEYDFVGLRVTIQNKTYLLKPEPLAPKASQSVVMFLGRFLSN